MGRFQIDTIPKPELYAMTHSLLVNQVKRNITTANAIWIFLRANL